MMKRPIIVYLLLFLCAAFSAPAQEGPHASSGIGIIAQGNDIIAMGVNFPMAELSLFSTAGYKQGVIFKKDMLNLMFRHDTSARAYRISITDLAEISFSAYCLKYFARQGDYVKVLLHTTGTGYWVSLTELGKYGFSAIQWMDVLLSKKTHLFSQVSMGINLRAEPDANSEKIALVKGPRFLIDLSGKTNGLWAEVRVSYFDRAPGRRKLHDAKPSKEWMGWMKVIDDAGYPNIWFYPEND